MFRKEGKKNQHRLLRSRRFYFRVFYLLEKYLEEKKLPLKCLLVMDNAPAHPPNIEEDPDSEYDFIKIKFLPPNTTPLIQPMDQQVISNFKKLYTKALFSKCFQVINDTDLTLRDFWKDHFNILHCVNLIDKAWNNVSYRMLQSAWKKLWPASVTDRDFEGFEEETAVVLHDIVSIGKSLELEVNEEDVVELLEDHKQEPTTEELVDLQREQVKVMQEEHSGEEEEEVVDASSAEIKAICNKWSEVQAFIEKHHPDKTVASRAVDILNDNVMAHFRKITQQRKRQVSLDRFLVQNTSRRTTSQETKKRKKKLQKYPQSCPMLPDVIMEQDSPSKTSPSRE
ncbi:tigger transposable element-derived protein 1-like [Neoarius graeffei]|uniref:tigger transposable element-derived protein 1-like n=1 Tax=Neoarius graeffei TaxID=443677 RepID=UPI00298C4ABE|nr:tigger transposable element-derived protein 1-like [Neoarius graeffei]